MGLRNISAWSIRNPIIPIVFFLALLLAGLLSFNRMDVVDSPDIDFPAVSVVISQPGAAPTEIENQITQRIEAAVRSISGVKNISSTASEGSSSTQVEFEIGTNSDQAVNDVKNAIDQIRGSLPDGILEPFVQKIEISGGPIGIFAVEANDMTIEQLSWFVDDTVSKRLLSIDGMAQIDRYGGVNREIRVTLDLAKMQSLGVTASQINSTLRQVNIDAAGGRADVGGTRQSLRVLGSSKTAFELSQAQITLGNGRTVKLGEVANVADSYAERTSISKVRDKEVVNFAMTRAKGASDVTVYDAAAKLMAKIEKENPGIKFILLNTSVEYTRDQYKSSMAAMIEGALLAIVVVFLFLRDWRATVISAVAIPLSAIPTFWFMDLMGFSLNSLSLLALGLVAGVLVDDAIVEIENIVRHMRMGKSAYQASIDAADEIGLAVVATSFCIVAVFLPVGLMPGVSGQFFKNFGLTVVASVLVSLAVARMITPMMAAYFLSAKGHQEHGGGRAMDLYMKALNWSLDKSKAKEFRSRTNPLWPAQRESRGATFWRKYVSLFLDHRFWMMWIGFAAFVLTVFMFTVIPMQFQPTVNSDRSVLQIEMVPGTTLERTETIADSVADMLYKQPEVESALERVREGSGSIYINLKKDRKKTSSEFERGLAAKLQTIPDARVSFSDPNGGGGPGGRDVTIMLAGSDPTLLENTAATLVEQMKTLKTVTGPRVSSDLRRPEIIIRPREDLAADLGVTTTAISQTIRIATMGEIDQNAAKFSLSDRQIPIRVTLPTESRSDIATIQNLPVQTATGGSVPLSRVADISFGSGPTSIQRYNQQRRVFIGADLGEGVIMSDAMKQINGLPIMKKLPNGVINAPFGEAEWQAEMLVSFMIALMSGVLLVFAVLVLLYHRLMSPLVNMGSLALAPLGGMLALAAVGQPVSMPVFIGILMLLGIVSKNSILLIDFAIEEMTAGKKQFDAIMEAGHKRAQPIVMTTVAMTAGMVPTAISLSGDGAWRAPMGTVVIGGLIVSTLLTLLIVPAGFSLADGFEKRVGPWLRRNLLTYDPNDLDDAGAADRMLPDANPDIGGLQPAE